MFQSLKLSRTGIFAANGASFFFFLISQKKKKPSLESVSPIKEEVTASGTEKPRVGVLCQIMLHREIHTWARLGFPEAAEILISIFILIVMGDSGAAGLWRFSPSTFLSEKQHLLLRLTGQARKTSQPSGQNVVEPLEAQKESRVLQGSSFTECH